jgi:hypothetical protein
LLFQRLTLVAGPEFMDDLEDFSVVLVHAIDASAASA